MKLTRNQRAMAIRDAILPWFLRHAAWVECGDKHGEQEAATGRLSMLLRSPFAPMQENTTFERMEAALRQRIASLPYVLNVRVDHESVFRLEWDDATGRAKVIQYKGGRWERDVLELAGNTYH